MIRKIVGAVGLLTCLAAMPAAAAYKLVAANQPATIVKSGLTVTPPSDWNKFPHKVGANAESWTLDGLSLNELDFYGGVPDGAALIKEFDKKNKPLPRFNKTMLAPDIVSFYETSFREAAGTANYATGVIEPATLAGQKGFRFTYSYTATDEVKRLGEGFGAVVDGRLYMITYNCPETHYFARDLENFHKIVASARIGPVPAGK